MSAKKTPRKKYTQYHKDGSLWAKGFMAGDSMEGYWEWFRKDGTIMRSGHFKSNKQAGKWTTYDKNGRVVRVTSFDK